MTPFLLLLLCAPILIGALATLWSGVAVLCVPPALSANLTGD